MYLLSFISLATCRDQDTDRQTWFLPSESFLEWHILPKPLFVERGKVAHPNITRIVCLFTFHLVWHREDVIFTKNTYVCKIVPLSRHVGLLCCLISVVWIHIPWLLSSHSCTITSRALERSSHLSILLILPFSYNIIIYICWGLDMWIYMCIEVYVYR